MNFTPREPFDAFTPLREAVTRLVDDGFVSPERLMSFGRSFPIDVIETEDAYIVEASLTGVRPENVQISTTGDALTIRVGRKAYGRHEEDGTYLRRERLEHHAPEMSRTITLPSRINAEKVSATYEHGVLTITVGKDEASKPRTITLHVAKEKVER